MKSLFLSLLTILISSGVQAGLYSNDDNFNTPLTGDISSNLSGENESVGSFEISIVEFGSPTCFFDSNGFIIASVSGETGEVLYGFDPDNIDTSIPEFNNLAAGNYIVYAEDETGAVVQSEMITLVQPMPVLVTVITSDPICYGDESGFIELFPSGGTGDYTFSFQGGEFLSDDVWTNLSGGFYSIVIMDANECQTFIDAELVGPSEITAAIEVINDDCSGNSNGSIDVSASGGTPGYMYSLNGSVPTSNGLFEDLGADSYTVTITDNNDCSIDMEVDVLSGTLELIDFEMIEDSGAGDGSIDITVQGGTGTLTYEWTGPDGFTSMDEDIYNLVAGSYSVTITDEEGCEITAEFAAPTGIVEWEKASVRVSPNPNQGQFNFVISGLQGKEFKYTITNALGKIIESQSVFSKNSYQTQIDIEDEANGMYFLSILVGNQMSTYKVIKN